MVLTIGPDCTAAADVCATAQRTGARILLDVIETLGARAVAASAASVELGTDRRWEGFAEERSQNRQTRGEDADVAFDIDPDARIEGRVYVTSQVSASLRNGLG